MRNYIRNNMNRKESGFIQSRDSCSRRDSCSNGFDLIPKQKEIREVLVLNFIGYNSTVMVYILLILLFTSDKLNSFKDRTKKSAKHCLQSFSGLRRNARSEQETRE